MSDTEVSKTGSKTNMWLSEKRKTKEKSFVSKKTECCL